MINAYSILVRKSEGKRPLGRHRRSWEDNIRMDLRETEWKDEDWMHLAQNRYQ
jgi:hypothetical protein